VWQSLSSEYVAVDTSTARAGCGFVDSITRSFRQPPHRQDWPDGNTIREHLRFAVECKQNISRTFTDSVLAYTIRLFQQRTENGGSGMLGPAICCRICISVHLHQSTGASTIGKRAQDLEVGSFDGSSRRLVQTSSTWQTRPSPSSRWCKIPTRTLGMIPRSTKISRNRLTPWHSQLCQQLHPPLLLL
jgi:hypothetical protein